MLYRLRTIYSCTFYAAIWTATTLSAKVPRIGVQWLMESTFVWLQVIVSVLSVLCVSCFVVSETLCGQL